MNIDISELTKLLVVNKIIRFGDFELKSGKRSWFYIDLRLISSYPSVFRYTIECYKSLLNKIDSFDAVAGVAVAGVPFSAVLGFVLNKPSLIVRPQSKQHGLKKLVEGFLLQNKEVVLIDDLITTGGSKIPGIKALRQENYIVKNLIVLIDRSQGNIEDLDKFEINLVSFGKIEDIFEECLKEDSDWISEEDKEIIKTNWVSK